jgi:hypothetical protein
MGESKVASLLDYPDPKRLSLGGEVHTGKRAILQKVWLGEESSLGRHFRCLLDLGNRPRSISSES